MLLLLLLPPLQLVLWSLAIAAAVAADTVTAPTMNWTPPKGPWPLQVDVAADSGLHLSI